MNNKKTALCTSQCGIIKPGMVVTYEMYESYGNEWVVIFIGNIDKNISVETFKEKFEII